METPSENPAGPQALYLFCLARRRLLPDLEAGGLDGRSGLRLVSRRELAAVCSAVGLEEFCGADAPQRLRDLAWVGPRACRHQEVVEAVMHRSPVLPVRFGTLFSCQEKLAQVLRRHYEPISRFLDRVQGRQEWGVKVRLAQARALEALTARRLAGAEHRLAGLPPGRRYLEEQRLRSEARRDLSRGLREACLELAAELEDLAGRRQERDLLQPEGGGGPEMVLNWAFLVPTGDAGYFKDRLAAFNRRHRHLGLAVECTGPWPPYSFAPALSLDPEP